MATTNWYTITSLNNASSGTFNSKNGYRGNSSNQWYWGKYSGGARGGYFGKGTVNGNTQHAVLVFWVPFPTVAVGSTKKVTEIKVQMYQNKCSGIPYGSELRAYACKGGPSGTNDTPANWLNGTGGVTGVFASDRSVTTGDYTGSTPATYTFSNTSGFAANTSGCFICFTGNDNQLNLTEFDMGNKQPTYPLFKFTYTDSSSTPTNYTITYNPNGAPGSSVSVSVASGSNYTLRSCPWTRPGYTFKGWNASPTGTTPASSPQTCTGNKTWYAIWQSDVSSKTISFYPISTSGLVGDYPGYVTAFSNKSTFTFPTASDLGWTRSGFTLQYWNTNRQLSGTNYYPGSSYQIAYSDLQDSYYAVWQSSTPNNVTFTFDPGSYSDDSKVSYTRSYAYDTTREVDLPDGNDYFKGRSDSGSQEYFYLTCDCGAGSFSNGVSVAQVSNDWTQLQTQYVQNGWSLNNGVTSAPYLTSYTPDRDVTFYPYWGGERISHWQWDVVLKIPNEQPTRSGYSFVEWNTSSSGRGTSYQPGGSISQLKTDGNFSNKTLYAIWQASEFKITFNPGNYGQGRSKELTTTNGQLTTLPADYFTRQAGTTYYFNYYLQGGTMSTPPGFSVDTSATYGPHYQTSNKTTYYHNYWNTDPNGSPKNNMGVDCWSCGATYSFTSDMTIYPEWGSSVPKYTLPTPTKVGYKFVAWNTNASGTGTNYAAGTEFALRSNKTFYAIWEPEWTIKINNGTTWGDYHVWIYTGATSNNGWQQAIPYVYDGSNWKLTKI